MTEIEQINQILHDPKRKFRPYNEAEQLESDRLQSDSNLTDQQILEGLKKLYENYHNIKMPKTGKCYLCGRNCDIYELISEDFEFTWSIEPCTESCQKRKYEREEARLDLHSELGQKMVRKYAKLSREQRRELIDGYEGDYHYARHPHEIINGIEHYDAGADDAYADGIWEEAEESDLHYKTMGFVDWLVFDYKGEEMWKEMKVKKEESE